MSASRRASCSLTSLLAGAAAERRRSSTRVTIDDHLYLKGPDGTELGIRVGMDATGKDALTVTRVGE
jgi:hypothetical protein